MPRALRRRRSRIRGAWTGGRRPSVTSTLRARRTAHRHPSAPTAKSQSRRSSRPVARVQPPLASGSSRAGPRDRLLRATGTRTCCVSTRAAGAPGPPRRGTPARRHRAGTATSRHLPLRRRDGAPGRQLGLRRREGAPRARDAHPAPDLLLLDRPTSPRPTDSRGAVDGCSTSTTRRCWSATTARCCARCCDGSGWSPGGRPSRSTATWTTSALRLLSSSHREAAGREGALQRCAVRPAAASPAACGSNAGRRRFPPACARAAGTRGRSRARLSDQTRPRASSSNRSRRGWLEDRRRGARSRAALAANRSSPAAIADAGRQQPHRGRDGVLSRSAGST